MVTPAPLPHGDRHPLFQAANARLQTQAGTRTRAHARIRAGTPVVKRTTGAARKVR